MPIPLCDFWCIFSCPDGTTHEQESYFAGESMPINGCCANNVADTCITNPTGISRKPQKQGLSSMNKNKMKKVSGDWGGLSFQCDETPFTSATGDKETSLGGGGNKAIGGKKNYTCKCIQASEGGEASFTQHTISAWSSLAANRKCKRMGRACFLVSHYGT